MSASTPITQFDELYLRLNAAASPEAKLELLREYIGNSPQQPIHLAARDGLSPNLDGVNFSALKQEWRAANFEGAQLRHADFSGVNLQGANLKNAMLGGANLTSALLEGVDLVGADLVGANLTGARLDGSVLQSTMLEDANLQHVSLRFADLREAVLENANLQHADLWGANLTGAYLSHANFQDAILGEANLQDADLSHANLNSTSLSLTNFSNARLTEADLRNAKLDNTGFLNANLTNARLEEAVLFGCDIRHVSLAGAWLERTQLHAEQLDGAIGEETAGNYEQAGRGYLVLERNFEQIGDTDAASWAYGKRRRMQKLAKLARARAGFTARRWERAITAFLQYATDELIEWVCDYGESVPRVLRSMIVSYIVFTLLYLVTGSVVRITETSVGTITTPTYNLIDVAIFSLKAMSAGEPPSIGLGTRTATVDLLTSFQVLVGVFLTGLLGFVAGNRIRR